MYYGDNVLMNDKWFVFVRCEVQNIFVLKLKIYEIRASNV